jgi:hypothetical protein
MTQQSNNWKIVHQYQRACELAEKHGFEIKQDSYDKVIISAKVKDPYVTGINIVWLRDFECAISWFEGYAQHILDVKNS